MRNSNFIYFFGLPESKMRMQSLSKLDNYIVKVKFQSTFKRFEIIPYICVEFGLQMVTTYITTFPSYFKALK